MVLCPTHIKGNILDLVLTNNPEKIVDIQYTGRVGKSDHETLVIEISAPISKQEYREPRPVWSKANWEEMRKDCANINWREELGRLGTETAWEKIKVTLGEIQQRHVPTRTWKTNTRPSWLSSDLLREIRRKRRLWSKYKKDRSEVNLTNYKKAERDVVKKIRNAKRRLKKRISADKENTKPFYSYIRSRTNTRPGVGPIKVDGETISDEKQMTEE